MASGKDVYCLLALAVVHCALLGAQQLNGELVGILPDAAGGSIPGATVEALNVATGVTPKTSSGSGQHHVVNRLHGSYHITAAAIDVGIAPLREVRVDSYKVATANLTMQIGQVATTVAMGAAFAVIHTTMPTFQSTFDKAANRDLPVTSLGRGPANLALLNAGVSINGALDATGVAGHLVVVPRS